MNNYQVLFSGEVSPQANKDIVRAKLACELDIDDRKAAQLFSGRTVVIKSQLSHRQAIELQEHLASLGAVCRVKDLTPQNDNVADFRVERDRSGKSDATLRDITAAHTECPRCGHMQLEATHCTRCGVDIAAAVRQRQKEDLIIEKKIRELRAKQTGMPGRAGAAARAKSGAASPTAKSRGVGWFRKSS